MELSVLFVNYSAWGCLAQALDSVHAHPPRDRSGRARPYEVVVVDNDSPLRPADQVAAVRARLRPGVDRLVDAGENGGYAKGMRLALAHSSGRFLVASNPDVVFQPECLHRLVAALEEREDVGASAPETFADAGLECRLPTGVAPRWTDPPRQAWAKVSSRAARRLARARTPRYLHVWRPAGDVDLEMFAGWAFAMRRDIVERVGFLDPIYPLYYEDTDLSRRVRRAGLRIVQVRGARLVHLYDQSARTAPALARERHDVSERRFFRRWHGLKGALAVDAARAFLRSGYARARTSRPPDSLPPLARVEHGRPVIELTRAVADFLVEIAFEPAFLLAAAAFGSGPRWSPGPALAAAMVKPTFFRVVDLTDGRLRELGRWRFEP